MSKDLNPINIDKLKETNIINQLKKEFYKSKTTLYDIKNKQKILETKLKKAKPNIIRQSNTILENELKALLQEYYCIQDKNNALFNQLEEMKNYSKIFEENHKKIEELKNKIEEQEKNIVKLKDDIRDINNKKILREELLDRQKLKNINLNK
jgi:predicted  nucleic acid-binding Zn-ribbon protein